MNNRIRYILLTILFIPYGDGILLSGETNYGYLAIFKPQNIREDLKIDGVQIKNAFQIGMQKYVLTGVDYKNDNKNDYGIRLFVVDGNTMIFRSKGAMDSWYINLTFFKSKASNKILILSESGDEGGSYGFAVYELDSSNVTRIGYIGAIILDKDKNILSAVPFVEIAENKHGYIFTFTEDVTVRDNNRQKYKSINKRSLKYIYEGKGGIKEIID